MESIDYLCGMNNETIYTLTIEGQVIGVYDTLKKALNDANVDNSIYPVSMVNHIMNGVGRFNVNPSTTIQRLKLNIKSK